MIRSRNKGYDVGYDWWIIVIYLLLVVLGFLSIHSSSYNSSLPFDFAQRSAVQIMWIGLSVIVGVFILSVNKDFFFKITVPLYIGCVIIQLLMIFIGTEVNGARSWIRIGSIGIQPAEFGKFIAALMLAQILNDYEFNIKSFRGIMKVFGVISLPMLLIVFQNDTGSALVYGGFAIVLYICGLNSKFYSVLLSCIILFIMTLIVKQNTILWFIFLSLLVYSSVRYQNYILTIKYFGITLLVYIIIHVSFFMLDVDLESKYITLITIGATLFMPIRRVLITRKYEMFKLIGYFISWSFFTEIVKYSFDNLLKIHQKKRILDLFGLESDLRGWGYNVNQSMIAIGSGGLTGKGYMNGTQTKYDFVPEQTTDFIFCTIGEEGGFVMSLITVLLFSALIFRLFKIARRTNDNFAKIYTYGVISIFTTHVFVNIGMTIGMVPVIGIPLPFISYGGSSLISFTIMLFISIKMCADSRTIRNTYLKR